MTILETLEGLMGKLNYHVLGVLDTLFGFGNLNPIFELTITLEYNLNNLCQIYTFKTFNTTMGSYMVQISRKETQISRRCSLSLTFDPIRKKAGGRIPVITSLKLQYYNIDIGGLIYLVYYRNLTLHQ